MRCPPEPWPGYFESDHFRLIQKFNREVFMKTRHNEQMFEIESGFCIFRFRLYEDGTLDITCERKTDQRWNSVNVDRPVARNLMRWLDGDL